MPTNWWIRITEHLRRILPELLARPAAVLIAVGSLAAVLVAVSPGIYTVYITDREENTMAVISRENNPEKLLSEMGVQVEDSDICYFTTYPGQIQSISIQKTIPFTVQADGEEHIARLPGGNVQDALEKAGITLGEHDYTEPGLNAPLQKETAVQVHRVEYQDTVTTESIPYETEYQYTSLFYRNKRRQVTVVEGHEGTRELTWRERWVDGGLESSQMIAVRTTLQPQNTIIKAYAAGAPVSSLTGPDGTTNKPTSYRAMYTGRSTGYSSSRSNPRGASGRRLTYGTCAVNPAQIPYGTLLYIESTNGEFVYGYAIAADTGGALMAGSGLVDLYYETHSEALMNAVQQVNVYVVG